MLSAIAGDFQSALKDLTVFLSLRLLPYFLYALLGSLPERSNRTRLSAAIYVIVPSLGCAFGSSAKISYVFVAAGYYFLFGLTANELARALARSYVTRGAVLVASVFGCVYLPAFAFSDLAGAAFLAVGCEFALKMYSYIVETARLLPNPPRTKDALFFLFVDPTLLYTARGTRMVNENTGASGLWRAAGGVLLMLCNLALLSPMATSLQSRAGASSRGERVLVLFAYGTVRLLNIYAAHSSLASLDVGLMHQLGWTVRERYDYPLLARSPLEFWRRWNIYVRMWLEAYVFLPVARKMINGSTVRAAHLAAAGATLAASAAIHSVFAFAARQQVEDMEKPAKFFVAAGIFVLVWGVVGGWFGGLMSKAAGTRHGRRDLAMASLGRCSVFGALVIAVVVWG